MHVDLVESLRCPNPHADGWLVAAADRIVARRIIEGFIGCPVCRAEWAIRDGELDFRQPVGARVHEQLPAHAPLLAQLHKHAVVAADAHADAHADADADADPQSALASVGTAPGVAPPDPERLAALLDVHDHSGTIALLGTSALGANALHALTGVQILAVNPPPDVARSHSRLRVEGALPLGVGTLRGVHCDAAHATREWLLSASRAVRRGGRLVAPAAAPVPAEVRELARDDDEWVGEVREAASGLVPLRRSGDPMRHG